MDVRILTTANELSAIEPQWLDLWRRDPGATPFQSPMWLLPWWQHFGSNDLRSIALRDGDRLQAFAPLYVVREDDESLGMFIGTGMTDYLDALWSAADLALWSAADLGGLMLGALQNIDCHLWDLQQLRPTSPLLTTTTPDGWSDNVEDQDPCPVLCLENSGAELENLISPHFRKKLRYYRRSLERAGAVTFEQANDTNLDALLGSLFDLHGARWKRRGMLGMLADDVVQQFHRQVARRMLGEGALRLLAMRAGERVVAVIYGFAHQQTVYYYLSGYDPDLEKMSPGTLIVACAIEQAVREGAKTFDFLRGAEEYKYAWGAKDRMNRRRQLFAPASS